VKPKDDCLAYPELYRDRLEISLAFSPEPAEGEAPKHRITRTLRALATSLAICTGFCLAHIVGK
jgi:hypothetical protein